jgi:hypothetical protein
LLEGCSGRVGSEVDKTCSRSHQPVIQQSAISDQQPAQCRERSSNVTRLCHKAVEMQRKTVRSRSNTGNGQVG